MVSEDGNDSLTCGLSDEEPCLTLSWLLRRFSNETDSDGPLSISTDKSLQIDNDLVVSK